MKKFWPAILLVGLLFLFVFGYLRKDNLNRFISGKIQQQAQTENAFSARERIQKEYNYQNNNKNFDFTLLEFSSTGCTICKQMEPVLREIENSEEPKVNVAFLHIMKPDNLDLMKYYGISAVPMQILLDSEGNEFFRHYGFISAEDLLKKFRQQ
ncbi:thioredoxin fold domain-containing protein [Maribellus comscasis]|uniref:Thioredoxin fold domain-containing protein n=1 Tax=Maribellus comscasis TaxID=2681766 RepID=A0A6I6JHX2_9BACT|nr:thioredoxin family protein [Maribellus comscasis]QGY42376.1 thioredoxin fold domain-containing protein [Maribellus comscasis]